MRCRSDSVQNDGEKKKGKSRFLVAANDLRSSAALARDDKRKNKTAKAKCEEGFFAALRMTAKTIPRVGSARYCLL